MVSAAVAGATTWTSLWSSIPGAPEALNTARGMLPEVAAAAAIVAAAVIVIWVVRGRLVRGRRVRAALVPSEGFEPSGEEIIRFAGQLSRGQSASSRVALPAGGRAIRVSLVSAGEGRMAHVISGPSGLESMLNRRPLDQVQVRATTDVLPPRRTDETDQEPTDGLEAGDGGEAAAQDDPGSTEAEDSQTRSEGPGGGWGGLARSVTQPEEH